MKPKKDFLCQTLYQSTPDDKNGYYSQHIPDDEYSVSTKEAEYIVKFLDPSDLWTILEITNIFIVDNFPGRIPNDKS